jgi:hypothetical protein
MEVVGCIISPDGIGVFTGLNLDRYKLLKS